MMDNCTGHFEIHSRGLHLAVRCLDCNQFSIYITGHELSTPAVYNSVWKAMLNHSSVHNPYPNNSS